MTSLAVAPLQSAFADKIQMQHRLFAELSRMFGREVPLYDKSLLVNRECNRATCSLLSAMHRGFQVTDEQLDKASGERHGAIRIGTAEEYRWVASFFAAFALEPHDFYDMTSLGAKSQPIIATAFRSAINPEHRVFTSLLMLDGFDAETRARVEQLLAQRQVFSDRAKELAQLSEDQGGLTDEQADELIREGTERIFKWTGKARDHKLYKELCDKGFKIAADIACFQSHHLNHLTPNTFCMDLYVSAMKHRMGEIDREEFLGRAGRAMRWLRKVAHRDYLKLHFRHLKAAEIDAFTPAEVADAEIDALASKLADRLAQDDLDLTKLKHSGFKDFTEGPPVDALVLLRQDSYKALTEPVTFQEADGTQVESVHTARFGEIEQRFYATTPTGRTLYDRCLAEADQARDADPGLAKRDFEAYQQLYAKAFAPFPTSLRELLGQGLVYGRWSATTKGEAAAGSIDASDPMELERQGYLRYEGLRYEDFLPFSAAGIFASNLGQYGTKTNGAEKPTYSRATLEKIMDRRIIDPASTYAGMQAESLRDAYQRLGLLSQLPPSEAARLDEAIQAYKSLIGT